MFRAMIVAILIVLLISPFAAAADDDNPTIGILAFPLEVAELEFNALLNVLQGYGLLNEDERAALDNGEDINGEQLNIFWGSADLSVADAAIVVENAVDREADALVIFSTTMTQVAINLTKDLPNPPVILFSTADPYVAGIADSACIKPDHVTGTYSEQNFEVIFDALQLQMPDMDSVGLIYTIGTAASEQGARKATAVAESRGIAVEVASVTALSDFGIATDAMIGKEVDAIILSNSSLVVAGAAIATEAAAEAGVPVVTSNVGNILYGATFGIGKYRHLQVGYDLARILVAWLNGEADIAATGIHVIAETALGMNLNSASQAQITVSDELLALADAIVTGDKYQMSTKMGKDVFQYMELPDEVMIAIVMSSGIPGLEVVEGRVQMPLANLLGEAGGFATGSFTPNAEMDAAFVASLQCTDEMIAEQQAALDEG